MYRRLTRALIVRYYYMIIHLLGYMYVGISERSILHFQLKFKTRTHRRLINNLYISEIFQAGSFLQTWHNWLHYSNTFSKTFCRSPYSVKRSILSSRSLNFRILSSEVIGNDDGEKTSAS